MLSVSRDEHIDFPLQDVAEQQLSKNNLTQYSLPDNITSITSNQNPVVQYEWTSGMSSKTCTNVTNVEQIRQKSQMDIYEFFDKEEETRQLPKASDDKELDVKYKDFTKRERFRIICCGMLAAFITFIIFCFLSILVVNYLENYKISSNIQMGMEKVRLAEGNIEKQLTKTFNSLLVMKDQVLNWNFSISQKRFEGLSSRLSWVHPEVNNFEFAIGYNATLQFIYPPVSGVLGYNMGTDPKHRLAMNEAIQKNETTIYGPISLIEGGVAVIAQHPIFFVNDSLLGFAVELLSFDKLFSTIDLTGLLQGYQYQIFDYYQNSVFLQRLDGYSEYEPTIYQTVPLISDTIFSNITVYNCRWKILLRPIEGWNANSILWAELIISILVCLCAPAFMFVIASCAVSVIFRGGYKKHKEELKQRFRDKAMARVRFRHEWNDICERFKERTNRMQKIINNLPSPVMTVSVDGKILSINFALTNLYGYDFDSLRKLNFKDLIPDFEIEKAFENGLLSTTKHSVTIIDKVNTRHSVMLSIVFSQLKEGTFGLIAITPNRTTPQYSEMVIDNSNSLISDNFTIVE